MTTCIDVYVRPKKNSEEDEKNKKTNNSTTIIIILTLVFGSIFFLLGIIIIVAVVNKKKRNVPKTIYVPTNGEKQNHKINFEDFLFITKHESVSDLRKKGKYHLGNSDLRKTMIEYLNTTKNDIYTQNEDFVEIFNNSKHK